jgi:hypothetical protein
MRLYQLVPTVTDVVVHDDEGGQTVVLTPYGAIFDSEFTDDTMNMTVAFGMLVTSDKWRMATQEEINELRANPSGSNELLREQSERKRKPRRLPALRVIQGGRGVGQ